MFALVSLVGHGGGNYKQRQANRPVHEKGVHCTAEEVAPDVWRVRSRAPPRQPSQEPTTFLEVLEE